MSNQIVYLKDHKEAVLEFCIERNKYSYLPIDLIKKGLDAQIENNLRYNKKTGKGYCNQFSGYCSSYVYKSDIPEYENDSEAACWQFAGDVRNSASRLQRGYSAI